MQWKVGEAKQRLSDMIRQAETEPQLIYNRERLVAAVVDGESFKEFQSWEDGRKRRSLWERFAELRRIAAEDGYELKLPRRRDRRNAFAKGLSS